MAEESVEEREKRADFSSSPEELEKLAEDKDKDVRKAVAGNANTPASVQEKLAEDKSWLVRKSAAGNVNTPISLLEKLAEDKKPDVRITVAENENTPVSLLEKMVWLSLETKYPKATLVRSSVAGNPNTPVSLLEKLAEDKSADVRRSMLYDKKTPASVLEKLAEDKEFWVRRDVAENPNTPASALEELAEDKDKGVRSSAVENVNIPVSMLEKLAAIQVASIEKIVEKINNWISESGKPIRCFSDYIVWQNEREEGTFTVKQNGESEEIEGYMMWENKSSVILTWELPDSAQEAIATLEKKEWSYDEIKYDEQEGFESSAGSGMAFDKKDNTIGGYDDFESGGEAVEVGFGSSYGPSAITITYENQKEVVFNPSEGDSWTVKTTDGQPETIPNYEAVLVLVRKLLK